MTDAKNLVAVSQEDREAAAQVYLAKDDTYNADPILHGEWDDSALVQAFANHAQDRLAAAQAALRPFAAVADEYDDSEDDAFEVWQDAGPVRNIRETFRLGLFRKARSALSDASVPSGEGEEIARLRSALEKAEDALRNYACHGGPSQPCLRSADQCENECGDVAGNALLTVLDALSIRGGKSG